MKKLKTVLLAAACSVSICGYSASPVFTKTVQPQQTSIVKVEDRSVVAVESPKLNSGSSQGSRFELQWVDGTGPKAHRVAAAASDAINWQNFGTAKLSSYMLRRLTANGIATDSVCSVEYAVRSESEVLYRLNGILGADIIMTVNPLTRETEIVPQETGVVSPYFGVDPAYNYENFYVMAQCSGMPTDGLVILDELFYLLVGESTGFNFSNERCFIVFESDLFPQWESFGTATMSADMIANLSDFCPGYNYVNINVDFRKMDDAVSQYRFNNLLGTDIIMITDAVNNTSVIYQQETGVANTYWGADEYADYPYFNISAKGEGVPSEGKVSFPSNFIIYAGSDYSGALHGEGVSIDFMSDRIAKWEHFGVARPSEWLINGLNINCGYSAEEAYEVDYRIVDDRTWEYRINGFLGINVILTSDNTTGITTIKEQATAVVNIYYDGEAFSYREYHVAGANYGTPRDGRLTFNSNFWMFVAPNYGYNFSGSNTYMDFESELNPVFKILSGNMIIGPDDEQATIKVERKNVDRAEMKLFKRRYVHPGTTKLDTIAIDTVNINADNTISVPLKRGRGYYSMLLRGVDEVGVFGQPRYVTLVSNRRDTTHQWEPLGKGLFKDGMYIPAWPNGNSQWVETEIEKATDTEGLYRAVNPFKIKQLADFGFKYNDEMDFYLEFGPAVAGDDLLPTGVSLDGICPMHVDDPSLDEGWFRTNYGVFSLPGVPNFSIVFSSPTTAVATPQVKSARYVVVPADVATTYSELPDLEKWFEAGLKTSEVIPDASGNLAFDLAGNDDSLCMVVASGLDENKKAYAPASAINYSLNGWVKVGAADLTPTIVGFTSVSRELITEVYVNPLDRSHIRLLDPYKPLEGTDTTCVYDFSADRSVYLIADSYRPVFSCNLSGSIEEVGPYIGISGRDYYGDYAEQPEVLDYRFECKTNLAARSGYGFDQMEDDEYYNYPRRYGSMVVFPVRSMALYALVYGIYENQSSFSFYAPMKFNVDETVTVSSDGQTFTVGEDVTKMRVLVGDVISRSGEITLEEFIADETLGEIIMVANGKSEALLRPTGTYHVLAVAYNDGGEVVNAFETDMALTPELSAISDITLDSQIAPVYYNLQGVRVDNPRSGEVVIERRGDRAVKKVIR